MKGFETSNKEPKSKDYHYQYHERTICEQQNNR